MTFQSVAQQFEEKGVGEIRFDCPQCGARLLADKEDSGAQGDCPKCGAGVVIPGGVPLASSRPHQKLFYIYKDEQQLGPYPLSLIMQMLAQKKIVPTDWAWTEGMVDWQPLATIPEIPFPAPPPPPRPPAPSQAPLPASLPDLFQRSDGSERSAIDTLEVDESWKEKFRLIEEAGGFNGLHIRNPRVLSFRERLALTFNIGGLVLGPLYYFWKGMWVKGTFYTSLAIAFAALHSLYDIAFAHYLIFPLQFLLANLATGDYYLWKVHKKQLW